MHATKSTQSASLLKSALTRFWKEKVGEGIKFISTALSSLFQEVREWTLFLLND
jgi:hypothetical protein